MEETEIWRKTDYPNIWVSNLGNFRKENSNLTIQGCIKRGYRSISLGKGKEILLHILIVKTFPDFCGKWFEGCHIHHKNFDKLDNKVDNLIVLSAREHLKLHYTTQPDSFKKPSKKRSLAIKNALLGRRATERHISVIQTDKDGAFIKMWDCGADISKELQVSQGNISSCCKGKIKTAYGFIWKYNTTENYLESIMFKSFKEKGLKIKRVV